VFDATKSKFSDVAFEQVNLDENKELASKYAVSSIPRVVFLDGAGNVLYNGGPSSSVEGFTSQIQQYH